MVEGNQVNDSEVHPSDLGGVVVDERGDTILIGCPPT